WDVFSNLPKERSPTDLCRDADELQATGRRGERHDVFSRRDDEWQSIRRFAVWWLSTDLPVRRLDGHDQQSRSDTEECNRERHAWCDGTDEFSQCACRW